MEHELQNGLIHELPEDMAIALGSDLATSTRWNKLTPIQRNEWICWVTIVKKPETRVAHISRMLENLNAGKKTPCCWAGCPHR